MRVSRWLHSRLLLFVCLATATHLAAQTPTPVRFAIGSIPPQRVWYSELARLEFVVHADSLGAGATLSAVIDPGDSVTGSRTFDPASGLFVYVPAATDAESFTVEFHAVNGASSAAQTVEITPLRPLPAEAAVFGLAPNGPLPDPASRDFLDVSVSTVTASIWFNGVQRPSVRDVTVIGHTVVLQPGHTNGLWDFNDSADLRSFTIHADTVVVRGAMHLPQTNIAIYATEVRFEDQDGQAAASLSTVPLSTSVIPASRGEGKAGHDGGSLTLFADAITGAGTTTRFILDGGKGQAGGPGVAGTAGASRSVITSISNGLLPTWSWTNNTPTSGTIYAYYQSSFLGIDTSKKNPSGGDPGYPGDGGDALPGGKPGIAGNGGAVTSNLVLASWVRNPGGVQGDRAPTVPGGAAGTPRTAYKRYFNSDEQYNITSRFSTAGASAAGPNSAKPTGDAGVVVQLPGDLRWLDPLALHKVLVYLRRAFLAQHFDYVRETTADYVALLEAATATDAWLALSADTRADLTQIRDELRNLHHRIESNLDYFGNPAGWVPMLSFEVNKLAFDNEIPRALRVMYLNYWLGTKAQSIQQKIDAMTKLRAELRDEVEADRTAYSAAIAAIPGLEFQATQVQNQINQAKTDIESLKNDLLPKAKNIALLKKTARALGAVAEIFPVGQPFVGAAGRTVSELTYVDPDDPWVDGAIIIGTNAAGAYSEAKAMEKAQALQAGTDAADPNAEDQGVTVAQLQTLQQPLLDVLGESINQIRNSQSPTPEVEAELQRLLADEPAYKALVKQIRDLNRAKTDFATQLAQTMQTVMRLSLAITRNLLTIDRLNRSIQEGSATLNPETLSYLGAMNERARDRLLKYHYFVARAFEYRMLQPYEGELDLTLIFEEFEKLAKTPNGASPTAPEYDNLRAVYEEQISSVAFTILSQYNSNRPSLSAPVRLVVSQEILDAINAGEPAALNLADEGIFLPDQENVRIVNLKVLELEVSYAGSPDDIFYADMIFQHAGVSRLQKEGETYLFRHYNEDTRSKIEWTSRFDPFDSSIDPVQPAAADQSLLKALLSTGSSSPSTDDLLIYSRPAADADLLITKQVSSRNGAGLTVTRMRIEVQYDFSRMSDQIKTLNVVTDSTGPQTRVTVVQTDRNGRADGEGVFERAYNVGANVTLAVEERIGQYQFDHWEGLGIATPTAATTSVALSASREVKPVYRLVTPRTLTVAGGSGSGTYVNGDVVTIAAVVPDGYRFVRWDGAGVADATLQQTTVVLTDDASVSAVFAAIGSFHSAMVNVSSRAQVGIGADILIPGFFIAGSAPKEVLVRVVGPTIGAEPFNVGGVLADPTLKIYNSSGSLITTNDDWGTSANLASLQAAMLATGAFPLLDGSKDAAVLVSLPPGGYTVHAAGSGDTTGVAVVEVYDVDGDTSSSRLVNISGRAQVGTGADILIPGFSISGNDAKTVLVRVVGPSLGAEPFNVPGVLVDPMMTVYQGQTPLGSNDDWGTSANAAQIASTAATVGAFPLLDGGKDAAMLLTLQPGTYTIHAAGVGGTTGVALVEVYEVQ